MTRSSTAGHRRVRWVPIGGIAAFIVAVGCGLVALADRHWDSSGERVAEENWQRFWLVNAELSYEPGGAVAHHIEGPRLIAVRGDGLVRGVFEDGKPFTGYLAPEFLRIPQEHKGLFLYAQERSELSFAEPEGSPAGFIYPGAFVSVVPGRETKVRIASTAWGWPMPNGLVVGRRALGLTPKQPASPKPSSKVRAVQLGVGASVWTHRQGKRGGVYWEALLCRDLWLHEESGNVSQFADGIELWGSIEGLGGYGTRAARTYMAQGCPAHAVVREGRELVQFGPAPNRGIRRRSVEAIPAGYVTYQPPDTDPLSNVIAKGASVYWLRMTEDDPVCDGWRFETSNGRDPAPRGNLVRREVAASQTSHPFEYRRATGVSPAELHLGSVQVGGRTILKCYCEYDYKIVGTRGGKEVHALGRALPGEGLTGVGVRRPRERRPQHLVAYDPGEVERWFLSKEACEAARRDVASQLRRDVLNAPRLGTHALTLVFDY